MAKSEHQRWRGWRTSQPTAPIEGSQPKKKPGTPRRKKDKLHPWFWIKNKRKGQSCEVCGKDAKVGQIVAFSRPSKIRCRACIDISGLKPKTSRPLAEERQALVIEQLRKSSRNG